MPFSCSFSKAERIPSGMRPTPPTMQQPHAAASHRSRAATSAGHSGTPTRQRAPEPLSTPRKAEVHGKAYLLAGQTSHLAPPGDATKPIFTLTKNPSRQRTRARRQNPPRRLGQTPRPQDPQVPALAAQAPLGSRPSRPTSPSAQTALGPSPSAQHLPGRTFKAKPSRPSRRSAPNPRMPSPPGLPSPGAGGGDRNRTDDPLLAKQVLSPLSYTPAEDAIHPASAWWAREDLNLRPHAYQACALTS
jgi:hypothetical protein